ncbi:hypothetical protein B0T25DRAFT_571583 [Lasiosphaeria hispida]|uniref:2EXR domain-containing protein n=1 Tax=Lasiosphaeria hispida TaxID=260671 RepID=A0AAJ0HBA3_9PEZI|nr:hypothetical protein B0T25DRAFT_571583 [Lasiosphaeria hispida]
MAAPPVFPFFRLLSFEVREMIWELALPSRIILADPVSETAGLNKASYWINNTNNTCEREIWTRNARPPTILAVCKEANDVARRHGAMLAVLRNPVTTYYEAYPGQSTGLIPPTVRPSDYKWTWFDPRKDTLLLFQQYIQSAQFIPPANALTSPSPGKLECQRQLLRYSHPRHELARLVDLDNGQKRTRSNALQVCIMWPVDVDPGHDERVLPLMVEGLSRVRYLDEVSVIVHELTIHTHPPVRGTSPTPKDMEVRQLCDKLFGRESPQRLVSIYDRPLLDRFRYLAELTESTKIQGPNPFAWAPRFIGTFPDDLNRSLRGFQDYEALVRGHWGARSLDLWGASQTGFEPPSGAGYGSDDLTATPPLPRLRPVVLFRHCGVRAFTHYGNAGRGSSS